MKHIISVSLHCVGQTLLAALISNPQSPVSNAEPKWLCRLLQGMSAVSLGALVIASLYLVSWEQRLLLCVDGQRWDQRGVWLWHSQADSVAGHTGSRPFIAITFGSPPNYSELAGVRRGEAGGSDWGLHWTAGWREEERDEAGSGRWSLIRGWTAANLLAASAQHRDYWTEEENLHHCGS